MVEWCSPSALTARTCFVIAIFACALLRGALGVERLYEWDFANALSDTITDSVGGVNATLVRAKGGALPTRTATGIAMIGTGTSASLNPALNNSGGHLVIDFGSATFGGPTTIEAVVMFRSAINFESRIFDCGNGEASNNVFMGNADADPRLTMGVYNGGSGSTKRSITTGSDLISIGKRQHFVFTYNGTTMAFYVDGGKGANRANTDKEPNSVVRTTCYIGKSTDPSDGYLNAEISSLTIYSGAMTSTEVDAAYAAVFPSFELAYFWDFANAANNTIVDSVGGVNARLRSRNGGQMPNRTVTGIVLVGTGPTYSLSNVGGAIVLDFNTVQFSGPMTVEMIVVCTAFNHMARLFEWRTTTQEDAILLYNIGATGELGFLIGRAAETKLLRSGTNGVLALGVRYHIVTSVSNTVMRMYINGVLASEKTDGWEPKSVERLTCAIGWSNNPANGYFSGEVSSFKIYIGALSALQIGDAYAATVATASPTASPTTAALSAPTAAPTSAPTGVVESTASPTAAPTSAPTHELGNLVDFTSPLVVREDDAYTGVSTVLLTIDQIMAPLTLAPTEIATIACSANASFVTFSGSNTITAGASGVATDTNGAAVLGISIQGVSDHQQISARTAEVTCDISAPSRKQLATIEITVRVVGVAQPSVSKICALMPGESPSDATLANCGSEFTTNGNQTFVILGGACAECPQPPFDGTTMVTVGGAAAHAALVLGTQGQRLVARLPSVLELLTPGQLLDSFDFTYYSLRVWTPAGVPSGEPLLGAVEIGRKGAKENGRVLACASPRALCPRVHPAQAGVYYTDLCQGFLDPTLSLGWNESAPPSPGYAFGRPPDCRSCPEGCRCPGGSRCYTDPGYFAPGGEDLGGAAAPIKCAADDELAKTRCAGWSAPVRAPAALC